MSFLFIKCAPFIFKIEKDLNIDDYKSKALEIHKILLKTHLNIFVSNFVFDLENYEFENLSLTKVIHLCVI
jgi:hypothetical protein